jgi:hypothetical protein
MYFSNFHDRPTSCCVKTGKKGFMGFGIVFNLGKLPMLIVAVGAEHYFTLPIPVLQLNVTMYLTIMNKYQM